MVWSVTLIAILVAITIITCVSVDLYLNQSKIRQTQTEMKEQSAKFFNWYMTSMEAVTG